MSVAKSMMRRSDHTKKLKDKYFVNLDQRIGKGTSGEVYFGWIEEHGIKTPLAVKVIPHSQSKSIISEKLLKEMSIMTELQHPNIVRLFGKFKTNNNFYIFMEYCGKGDLRKFMEKEYRGQVPEKHAKRYMYDILQGYQYLNSKGIVHRDLKLPNIMINEEWQLKIGDFGFATKFEEDFLLESFLGTPLNMAPEIMSGVKYGYKCDMWSIGTIMYELLFGSSAFKTSSFHELKRMVAHHTSLVFPAAPKISEEAKDLISRLLNRNPELRISVQDAIQHSFFDDIRVSSEPENETTFLLQSIVANNASELNTGFYPMAGSSSLRKSSKHSPSKVLEREIPPEQISHYIAVLVQEHVIDKISQAVAKYTFEYKLPLKQVSEKRSTILDLHPSFHKFVEACFTKVLFLNELTQKSIEYNYPINNPKLNEKISETTKLDPETQKILDENPKWQQSLINLCGNSFSQKSSIAPPENISCSIGNYESLKAVFSGLDRRISQGIAKVGEHAALLQYQGNKEASKELYEMVLLAIRVLKLKPLALSVKFELDVSRLQMEHMQSHFPHQKSVKGLPLSLGEYIQCDPSKIDRSLFEKLASRLKIEQFLRLQVEEEFATSIKTLDVTTKVEQMISDQLSKII